jgi:hypothetical protein
MQMPRTWALYTSSRDLQCIRQKRSKQKINIASSKFWNIANKDKLFDFSKFEYSKNVVKSKILCKKCNSEFSTSPNNYLNGKGCPFCKNKTEIKLYDLIKEKNNDILEGHTLLTINNDCFHIENNIYNDLPPINKQCILIIIIMILLFIYV